MKTLTKVRVTCMAGAALILGALSGTSSSALVDDDDHEITAEATIAGATGSGITGIARFSQTSGGILPTVRVTVFVRGLAANSTHGVHIHENGNCGDSIPAPPAPPVPVPFGGAGGHFDPGPFGNSGPDINHPYHMGDLPNLKANSRGEAFITHRTSRITLSAGPLSVFDTNGSAVIVHLNEDQGITGAAGTGVSGGPRIACGIIRQTH